MSCISGVTQLPDYCSIERRSERKTIFRQYLKKSDHLYFSSTDDPSQSLAVAKEYYSFTAESLGGNWRRSALCIAIDSAKKPRSTVKARDRILRGFRQWMQIASTPSVSFSWQWDLGYNRRRFGWHKKHTRHTQIAPTSRANVGAYELALFQRDVSALSLTGHWRGSLIRNQRSSLSFLADRWSTNRATAGENTTNHCFSGVTRTWGVLGMEWYDYHHHLSWNGFRKWHFRASKFQKFLGEHAPDPPCESRLRRSLSLPPTHKFLATAMRATSLHHKRGDSQQLKEFQIIMSRKGSSLYVLTR